VKVRGTRCRDGQVDGSSEEFQVSCLGCGVSRFDAGSARARSNATQRRWHARRGTPTPLQLQCVALHPLARLDSLSRSSASKTGRLGHTSRIICASRDWASPCAGVEQRRVEAWNFPDNGGETIVAWSLAPNLVMVDQHCIPPLTTRALFDPVFDSASTTSGLQLPRGGAGERPANHFQTMTMLRRGVLAGPEREL
jgi:hypothetical protein